LKPTLKLTVKLEKKPPGANRAAFRAAPWLIVLA